MAIKGKKKAQSRGSQARRRPAAAPRPTMARGTKKPWYRTTAGQSIAAITALVAVVVALVAVNNVRTANEEKELRRESLDNFTDQVKALVQTVTGPASELAAAPQAPPDNLKREAEGWRDAFTAAQTQAAQIPPAEGTATAQQLFAQALNLYRGAAVLLVQAADAKGQARTEMISTAAGQVGSADAVWAAAVDVLDGARDDAEMNASGVRSPAEAPPSGEMPTGEATIPVESEDEAGGDDGDDDS